MRIRHLQMRFILAGSLLLFITMAASLWSGFRFANLSRVVDDTLRVSQESIDFSSQLASALEREDDALLLAISQKKNSKSNEIDSARTQTESLYQKLQDLLNNGEAEEKEIAARLREKIDAYHQAGDRLLSLSRSGNRLENYHQSVNPLLRVAVQICGQIREENFRSMEQAGIHVRDEANRATGVVAVICVIGILFVTLTALWLAKSILLPVRELQQSVEAVRVGNFTHRVKIDNVDELGLLAAGFNRMTETLEEYRRSSLGELLTAKSTLEGTLNALPNAVFVIAPDGTIAAMNPAAVAILRDNHGTTVSTWQELPFPAHHLESIKLALGGDNVSPVRPDFSKAMELIFHGKRCQFFLTTIAVPDYELSRGGAVVVLDDISDFARLDSLRSELIGVASHELNSPLTTLRMMLLLLQEQAENLTPRQNQILAMAILGCEELGETIEELLDVTRVEAGQLRLQIMPVDFIALFESVIASLQPRLQDTETSVEIRCHCSSAWLPADRARMRIVLLNILTNALKYGPKGGKIDIQISSWQNAGENGKPGLQITVTDQGPGIPIEFRQRIFEKFFRVEHDRPHASSNIRGTGIGLYLCQEILKLHEGAIVCEAGEQGKGTRIVIYLPHPSK